MRCFLINDVEQPSFQEITHIQISIDQERLEKHQNKTIFIDNIMFYCGVDNNLQLVDMIETRGWKLCLEDLKMKCDY